MIDKERRTEYVKFKNLYKCVIPRDNVNYVEINVKYFSSVFKIHRRKEYFTKFYLAVHVLCLLFETGHVIDCISTVYQH